ncbi:MAG: ComF family protein [Phycisphaerae bacterium]
MSLFKACLDLVLPPHCLGCDLPGVALCETCRQTLTQERQVPACKRCGGRAGLHGADRCAACRRRPPRFDGISRVAPDGGLLGELLRTYKFQNDLRLEPFLARMVTYTAMRAHWFRDIDCVACVPTHWMRRMTRPIYPAERFGKRLAGSAGLPSVTALRRRKRGRRQVGLSWSARRANVRNTFVVTLSKRIAGKTVLIVDNVATTGSTLSACAGALKRAGAAKVYAAVLLRVDSRRR